MLNGLFEFISGALSFFYELVPDYAAAIALLTLCVMVVTTPLTLKGTRSMIEMQRLQPEIRRLQAQYKDDPQKRNEEMMRFYREHGINPLGGCFPLLVQAPVFSILYYVVQGLTNRANFVGLQVGLRQLGLDTTITPGFRPKYLDHSSALYRSLLGHDSMDSFGVDLARSASEALADGIITALPYLAMVAVIAALSWYQQKQIMGRNANAEIPPQQKMMMRIGPALYVFFAFVSPAAIGVYFLVSTAWRVGQQAYITRSLYGHEDAAGVQAQKAMAELRESSKKEGGGGGGLLGGLSGTRDRDAGSRPARSKAGQGKGGQSKPATNGRAGGTRSARQTSPNGSAGRGRGRVDGAAKRSGSGTGASGSGTKPHPRSRKKKKRK